MAGVQWPPSLGGHTLTLSRAVTLSLCYTLQGTRSRLASMNRLLLRLQHRLLTRCASAEASCSR